MLSIKEASELLQAAHAEEERCQNLKMTSKNRLEDAIVQLEQAEKHLFEAQLNLARLSYVLQKSNFQFSKPDPPARVEHIINVNGSKSIIATMLDVSHFTFLKDTHSITLSNNQNLAIVLD